jgi:hypothetical protein
VRLTASSTRTQTPPVSSISISPGRRGVDTSDCIATDRGTAAASPVIRTGTRRRAELLPVVAVTLLHLAQLTSGLFRGPICGSFSRFGKSWPDSAGFSSHSLPPVPDLMPTGVMSDRSASPRHAGAWLSRRRPRSSASKAYRASAT